MRRDMAKAKAEKIVRGSGNVFADLGFADADERQTKLRLAFELNRVMGERGMTQAIILNFSISQPKVSALSVYKLDGFSVQRLWHS